MGHAVKASAAMIGLSGLVAAAIAFYPHAKTTADMMTAQAPAAPAAPIPAGALAPRPVFDAAERSAAPAPAAAQPLTRGLAKPAASDVAAANRKLADALAQPKPDDGLSQIALAAGSASADSALGRPAAATSALAFADPRRLGDEAEATAEMIARAKAQLRDGAASSARLLLTRAAREGSPEALSLLGQSYDGAALAELGVKGVRADAAEARKYYRQAASAGSSDARRRLSKLGD